MSIMKLNSKIIQYLDYLALSYRNTEQNKYKYKMEGYDDKWIEAGTRRFASYTNLPIVTLLGYKVPIMMVFE